MVTARCCQVFLRLPRRQTDSLVTAKDVMTEYCVPQILPSFCTTSTATLPRNSTTKKPAKHELFDYIIAVAVQQVLAQFEIYVWMKEMCDAMRIT
jgi:hypothetical protein